MARKKGGTYSGSHHMKKGKKGSMKYAKANRKAGKVLKRKYRKR